jgi:predicted nucleotidyltransferase
VANEPNPVPELPAQVSRVLHEFIATAQAAFSADLRSIVLFGSAAEGRLRATSDVNLLLVLSNFEPACAAELRRPLRIAQAAIRLSPMLVLETELPSAITAFAEKFADILRRRKVLHGSDPFADVKIPRAVLAARLGQVLLNLILRLREAYVMRGLREEQLALVVADTAGPLRSTAASLLELQGTTVKSGKEALENFINQASHKEWHEVSQRLSDARETGLLPSGVADTTLQQLIDIANALRSAVGQLR